MWGALTVLRLLHSQQQQRGAGGYAKVTKKDVEALEASYVELGGKL